MPKKSQSRTGRTKPRTRRPVSSPAAQSTGVAEAPAAARPVAPPAARPRPSAPARRAPGLTINYAYLGHDLRTLAVLGPLMVVILVIAFFVLH
ncbi:MAG TPA: hypothetical protein VFB58_19120 [Chloroflexota bacterium]|nr:hypothetical protein [Chloroflexota bacterium]